MSQQRADIQGDSQETRQQATGPRPGRDKVKCSKTLILCCLITVIGTAVNIAVSLSIVLTGGTNTMDLRDLRADGSHEIVNVGKRTNKISLISITKSVESVSWSLGVTRVVFKVIALILAMWS